MPKYLDQLVLQEGHFSAEGYRGSNAHGSSIIVRNRYSPLLLTAPHATKHGRFDGIKDEDAFTGSLALLLGRELESSVIAAAHCDPDTQHPTQLSRDFLAALDELAPEHHLLVDVHGMSDHHGVGVCIGTGAVDPADDTLAPVVESLLRGLESFTPSVNVPFSAQAPYTLTTHAQTLGIPAIQVEIAARYRTPGKGDEKEHARFIEHLITALQPFSAA